MGRNRFSHVAMTVVMKVIYSCVFTFLFLALTACRAGEGKAGISIFNSSIFMPLRIAKFTSAIRRGMILCW